MWPCLLPGQPGKTRPPGCLRPLFCISPEEKGIINGTSDLVLWVYYQSQNIEALELTCPSPSLDR